MTYTTLSIIKNGQTRKYILFYAHFLQEAWLSEVYEADRTKIVRQFKCRKASDVNSIVATISAMGEMVLNPGETFRQNLDTLQIKLEKNTFSDTVESFLAVPQWLWGKLYPSIGRA